MLLRLTHEHGSGAHVRVAGKQLGSLLGPQRRTHLWRLAWPSIAAGGPTLQGHQQRPLFTCALRLDGTPSCWGEDYGTPELERTEYSAVLNDSFVAIDTGWNYSCGLRADGITTCWGDSDSDTGRYGDHGREWPPEGERFSSISTGSSHTCGLGTRDGSVVCWGENLNGQAFPPDDERFAAIDTGSSDTCGIRLDGTWGCWGFVSGVSGGHYVPAPDPDERLLPSRTAHSTCAGCVRMVLLCAGAVTAMARHRPQQLRGEPARTSHISKVGNYCSFYARNWLCSVSQGFWRGIYIGF